MVPLAVLIAIGACAHRAPLPTPPADAPARAALTRRPVDLTLDGGRRLSLPAGSALEWLGAAAPGLARVSVAEGRGVVPCDAVGVLPLVAAVQPVSAPPGDRATVRRVTPAGLEVVLGGPFAVDGETATVPAESLDMSIPTEAILGGDLSPCSFVDASNGDPNSLALVAPALARGVELPAGATVRLDPDGLVSEAFLATPATVAGLDLVAGSSLRFPQGCDVEVSAPGAAPRCMLLEEGRLRDP